MKFIWIDDNPERLTSAGNLATALDFEYTFVDVKGREVSTELKTLLEGAKPDLIIIDHNLIDSVKEDEKNKILIRRGSSAATIIRQTWKDCPIICISGMDAKDLDTQEKAIYEEIYSDHKISDHYAEISSIAMSFSVLKEHKPENIDDFFKLLGCPESEKEKLKAIIPKDLKENFKDGGLIVEISNWVRKILLNRPGFLYDRLWTSTYLGLNKSGFEKVEPIFENARYNGVFACKGNERWWKSELLRILGETVKQPGLPGIKSRQLTGVVEGDYSRCYVTGELLPETVAFIDETPNAKQEAMKLRETIDHNGFEKMLYFDEIRQMAAAE
ncbi:response regulator [uncultured Pedobacter sp.]|uniref:response regulator n=1 Tax=uncultured Pedobacter sp. TaxID=246139 RepID=UPI0025D0B973|nr:response regulator [uncultured Pedobacter sp.]